MKYFIIILLSGCASVQQEDKAYCGQTGNGIVCAGACDALPDTLLTSKGNLRRVSECRWEK